MNDIEYAELKRQEFVARPHNQGISTVASMITAGGNSTGEHAAPIPPTPFQQESVPKGFIVVSKDLLAEAIACNTDASLAEARHIINSVLKVSDDEIFREALKELENPLCPT